MQLPCLFHALTGLYCPACGTLRALSQLLQGNFLSALRLNPLTIIALPFFSWYVLSRAIHLAAGRMPRSSRAELLGAKLILLVVLVFWVLRNIPLAPFTYLAP
jgi:hypothetical protein